MPSEFDLIRRHFMRPLSHTVLGGGDDCALVSPSADHELAISTDMLVAGTHFFPDTEPESLGWKALAVNLSDLAAMGARPRWALVAAALPQADETWIAAFARGFFACATRFEVDLIGGDTTRGPLVVLCPTVLGELPKGGALRRDGARAGDRLWVSGYPGRAGLGLAHLKGERVLQPPDLDACLQALTRPQPRVELGLALRGVASAAIDISDGLLGDLGHILQGSGLAALLYEAALPRPLADTARMAAEARQALLAGGDDYELLFSAPPGAPLAEISRKIGLPLTCIGELVRGDTGQVDLEDDRGHRTRLPARGYDHFMGSP
ncbi:MAG: thiamine-phosphate kinase [Rhodocyclaceae bacterium]|nr:thiamine-phosphate kinase [Rhodocyclaceae bacterium]